MGIFNTIMEKLGLVKDKAVEAVAGTEAAAAEAPAAAEPAAPEVSASEAPQTVDVIAVCEEIASKNGANLNWKTSIVDLMKLLGIDSSLANRKTLAEELGCPKDLIGGDYAQMNVWLHKAVMRKLAENGGKVPADLTK
ncbi:DUF3597 domain-containing protein [uncultured Parasutterella sp.]|uniref:DUF3597 domain-containing protein n=1 Tax=uncultured Parasutterella sp. TaxID=1263098 RepID=UPI00272B1D41|nr:DUF3597 domain-containing protein [uncultured Parasutterella sp.]